MSAEPVTTYCPACGKTFRVPAELTGKKIACKGCQTHFVVQVDKPGLPVAAPVAKPASQVVAATGTAPAATLVKPAAAPPPPPATSAAPAAPGPPPSSDLPSIPFDDAPVPLGGGDEGAAMATVGKPKALEKVKIESTGPYQVVKLVTTGKMVHVGIENTLNEHATDGWRLQEVVAAAGEAYAILYREPDGRKDATS